MNTVRFYLSDISGCGYYRVMQPVKYIRKAYRDFRFKISAEMKAENLKADKVSVFQRSDNQAQLDCFRYAKQCGNIVVYELDDWVFDLHPENPGAKFYANEDNRAIVEAFLREADYVTTTTYTLARFLSNFNRSIFVFPNLIDFKLWDKIYQYRIEHKKNDNKIRIGWAGSPSHKVDIDEITKALTALLYWNKDIVIQSIGYDIREIKELSNHSDRIEFYSAGSVWDFGYLLADFDIGIAPLFLNDFNRAKSENKFLEYSALGIPTVATSVDPYFFINDYRTGFRIENNNYLDWYTVLKALVESPVLRRTVGNAARADVRLKRDLARHYSDRYNFYHTLLKDGKVTQNFNQLILS